MSPLERIAWVWIGLVGVAALYVLLALTLRVYFDIHLSPSWLWR